MSNGRIEHLKMKVQLNCFSCGQSKADHLLHLEWNCLDFQLCLCGECIKLDNDALIEKLLDDKPPWQKAA